MVRLYVAFVFIDIPICIERSNHDVYLKMAVKVLKGQANPRPTRRPPYELRQDFMFVLIFEAVICSFCREDRLS